eukprot:3287618-Pleurochrysis_carterae.AAC.7
MHQPERRGGSTRRERRNEPRAYGQCDATAEQASRRVMAAARAGSKVCEAACGCCRWCSSSISDCTACEQNNARVRSGRSFIAREMVAREQDAAHAVRSQRRGRRSDQA